MNLRTFEVTACHRKGPHCKWLVDVNFFIKLQKLENPFALCTLPGMQSPVLLALKFKSGGARAPPEYMFRVPLQHGVKNFFII